MLKKFLQGEKPPFGSKWKQIGAEAEVSARRRCAVAAIDEDHIVLVGGEERTGDLSDAVTMVEIATGKCREMPRLNRAKRYCSAIRLGSKLYVFGGWRGGSLNEVEVLDMTDSSPDRKFRLLHEFPMPQELHSATLVAHNGAIFVLGGYNDQTLKTVYKFQVSPTYSWSALPSLHIPRKGSMAVVRDGRLLVLGGYNYDHKNLSSVESYPLNDENDDGQPSNAPTWMLLTDDEISLPTGRAYGFAFLVGRNKDLCVAGGEGNCGKWLDTLCCLREGNNNTFLTRSRDSRDFKPFPGCMAALRSCLVFLSEDRKLYTLRADIQVSVEEKQLIEQGPQDHPTVAPPEQARVSSSPKTQKRTILTHSPSHSQDRIHAQPPTTRPRDTVATTCCAAENGEDDRSHPCVTTEEHEEAVERERSRACSNPAWVDLLAAFENVDTFELRPSLDLISKFSGDVSRMIEDSLRKQVDDQEIAAILSNPRLREFYLAILQHLKACVKAIETLSSGLVGECMGAKSALLTMCWSSGKSDEKHKKVEKIRRLMGHAIDKTIKQFSFLPASDLVGSTVGFLLNMKDSHEDSMAAYKVALFVALCDAMKTRSSYGGADGALELISRLTVRCYHDRRRIPEPDESFGWRKRQVVRIAGANNADTPLKEAGAKAAQQVIEYISNLPMDDETSLLSRLYEGYKCFDCASVNSSQALSIPDVVVAEVFGLGEEEVRQLPRIGFPTSGRALTRRVHDLSEGASPPEQRRSSVDSDAVEKTIVDLGQEEVWSSSSSTSSYTAAAASPPDDEDDVESPTNITLGSLAARIQELGHEMKEAGVATKQTEVAYEQQKAQFDRLRAQLSKIQKEMQKFVSTEAGGPLIRAYVDPGIVHGEIVDRLERMERSVIAIEQRMTLVERETLINAENVAHLNKVQRGYEPEPDELIWPKTENKEQAILKHEQEREEILRRRWCD